MYHGKPQVVIPLFFEQPYNGDQAEFLGAGVRVRCKYHFASSDLTPKLAAALQKATTSTTMLPAAQRISVLMKAHRWTAAEKAASKQQLTTIFICANSLRFAHVAWINRAGTYAYGAIRTCAFMIWHKLTAFRVFHPKLSHAFADICRQ